jgi:DNA-binding Xre family transcriptional regulator
LSEIKGGHVKSRLKQIVADEELRTGKRIRQCDIADATGLRQATISRWMAPKPLGRIDATVLEKLCEMFSVEVGDLLFIDRRSA